MSSAQTLDIDKVINACKENTYPKIWIEGDLTWWVKLNTYSEPFSCSKQLAMTYKK